MSGIYLHIPFCKQACHYCDFHFSTSTKLQSKIVGTLLKEVDHRKDFFHENETIDTIYFGGGTPSLLRNQELESILSKLFDVFNISHTPEITLEANPDDITPEILKGWFNLGINRLSLGVQTFHEPSLQFLNRNHSTEDALNAIKHIQNSPFENVSLDLIFGIHTVSMDDFLKDLDQFIEIRPQHISTYCLTIEENTTFGRWYEQNKLEEVNQEIASEQYLTILDKLTEAGYEQYEISNFSLPQLESKHNSGYWKDQFYLGLGPSAHSYNGKFRWANIASNPKYIAAIETNSEYFSKEEITSEVKYNETILTQLRKNSGLHLTKLSEKYPGFWSSDSENVLKKHIKSGFLEMTGEFVKLTRSGKLYADSICEDLFYV